MLSTKLRPGPRDPACRPSHYVAHQYGERRETRVIKAALLTYRDGFGVFQGIDPFKSISCASNSSR